MWFICYRNAAEWCFVWHSHFVWHYLVWPGNTSVADRKFFLSCWFLKTYTCVLSHFSADLICPFYILETWSVFFGKQLWQFSIALSFLSKLCAIFHPFPKQRACSKAFILNLLQISYIHSSHLYSHSNVPLSFPNVEPHILWGTEMTAMPKSILGKGEIAQVFQDLWWVLYLVGREVIMTGSDQGEFFLTVDGRYVHVFFSCT